MLFQERTSKLSGLQQFHLQNLRSGQADHVSIIPPIIAFIYANYFWNIFSAEVAKQAIKRLLIPSENQTRLDENCPEHDGIPNEFECTITRVIINKPYKLGKTYYEANAGGEVIKFNARITALSQSFQCGNKQKKMLNNRWHYCQ